MDRLSNDKAILQQQLSALTCDIQKNSNDELSCNEMISNNQEIINALIETKASVSVSIAQLTGQVNAMKFDNDKNRVLVGNLTAIR